MNARAIAIRCRWPPERVIPRSPDHGFVALSEPADELLHVGVSGRLSNGLVVSVKSAIPNVLHDGAVKQNRLLRNDADVLPAGIRGESISVNVR